MIILSNTTDKIQLSLSATVSSNQLVCYSSYKDTTSSSISVGRGLTLSNNLSYVDIVDSPASSTQRVVDYISVYNKDTTESDVSIYMYDNSNRYALFNSVLLPSEKLEYQDGFGFRVIDSEGSFKKTVNSGLNPTSDTIQTVLLSATVSVTSTTLADVTGLSFPVEAGKYYYFYFFILYTTASTAVGSRHTINGPTAEVLNYYSNYTLTATSITNNQGLTTYNSPGTANGTSAAGTNRAVIEGVVKPSANGTIQARFASENTNAVNILPGSICLYQIIY